MYMNPYGYQSAYQQAFSYPQQKQEIIKVNGKGGADAYQLAPNSSVLMLDETSPLVWLKITDGAGYATLKAYEITPHEEEQTMDLNSLEERIKRLEAAVNEQSNIRNGEREKNDAPKHRTNQNHDESLERIS